MSAPKGRADFSWVGKDEQEFISTEAGMRKGKKKQKGKGCLRSRRQNDYRPRGNKAQDVTGCD